MRFVAAVLFAPAVALLLAECGGGGGETRLTVEIGFLDPETFLPAPRTFEIRCDPPGGTAPDPEAWCGALAAHPAMLHPPEITSSCAGSDGIPPGVSVKGVADAEPVDAYFRCYGPASRADAEGVWMRLLAGPARMQERFEPPGVGSG